MRSTGHCLCLQKQPKAQFFRGVFITANGRWNMQAGRIEDHPQQPGSLSDSWRCGEQGQAAAPETQASEDTKASVRLGIAQSSRAWHGVILFNCGRGMCARVAMESVGINAIRDRRSIQATDLAGQGCSLVVCVSKACARVPIPEETAIRQVKEKDRQAR